MTPLLDKTAKYDRQLRLWATNGQAALEKARIALIGGTATGTECLKNLILPGIGSYTIIDPLTITAVDTGSNFFLDSSSIGTSRAAKTCELLQELNADVEGYWSDADPAKLIENDPQYFTKQFDFVIIASLGSKSLLKLSEVLWDNHIPMLVVKAIGFFGYLRVAVPEHTIVESHPESIIDLRMDVPWPELCQYATVMEMKVMNDNEHTHIPYILLLLHYLEVWKTEHGNAPSTFTEKSKFKDMIRNGKRNADEDNFDEAINNVWRACNRSSIPTEVSAILNDPKAHDLNKSSSDFWFLVRAVADFVAGEGDGLLPLAGTLPDMKADTNRYIALQDIYRRKALQDMTSVREYLNRHLQAADRATSIISDEDLATFCKHAAYLKLIRYRSLSEETTALNVVIDQDPSREIALAFYFAHKASEDILSSRSEDPEAHADQSIGLLDYAVQNYGHLMNHDSLSSACAELGRSGSSELHNIASLMGGIAAQETIKLITHQYVPINNTLIFNGIQSSSTVFNL